jgi:hypothetical protein
LPHDPKKWIFDFDPAAPGGGGGASVLVDQHQGLASFDGIHRNVLLPRRSTGSLFAEGLQIAGMPKPSVVEAYNVIERSTRLAILSGRDGTGTVIGNLLEDIVRALGGIITK